MQIKLTLTQFIDHSKYFLGYSPPTISRYRQVVNMFCDFSKVEECEDISKDQLYLFFLDGREKRKWSPMTFSTYHKSLNVFFNWCQKEGYVESNPMVLIEKPKVPKKLPPKLTKQEAMRILQVVDNYPWANSFVRFRNHAILSTFFYTGLRKAELLNLKLTDVDFENLCLSVKAGKGNKDRVFPISYSLVQSMERYLQERRKKRKTCPEFFVSANKNVPFTYVGLRRMLKAVNEASGISFTAHKLRHTFATLMLEGGCDIFSLSKMMGHSDIKTTTIYLAATPEHLRSQIVKHPLNNL